jgi:hypothetical protein
MRYEREGIPEAIVPNDSQLDAKRAEEKSGQLKTDS